jgi:uncharacterized protein involved in copper resistance
MRSVVLSGLFIVSALAMNAQKLSLTPQWVLKIQEHLLITMARIICSAWREFNPQVSLRLDYKFKQGFGPYIGASTSRSVYYMVLMISRME